MGDPIRNDVRVPEQRPPAPAEGGPESATKPPAGDGGGSAAPVDSMTRCAAPSAAVVLATAGGKRCGGDLDVVPAAAEQAVNALQLVALRFGRKAEQAADHASWLQRVAVSNYRVSPSGRVLPLPEAARTGQLTSAEAQLVRGAQEAAESAGKTARPLTRTATALAVLGGVVAGVEEAVNNDTHTSTAGRFAGAAGVGGVQTVAGLTPHGTVASLVSGVVDDVHRLGVAFDVFDAGPPPKAMEVVNNAGRLVGLGADLASGGGWRAVERFTHHVKHEQGSLSRWIAGGGEWLGENVLYKLFE